MKNISEADEESKEPLENRQEALEDRQEALENRKEALGDCKEALHSPVLCSPRQQGITAGSTYHLQSFM